MTKEEKVKLYEILKSDGDLFFIENKDLLAFNTIIINNIRIADFYDGCSGAFFGINWRAELIGIKDEINKTFRYTKRNKNTVWRECVKYYINLLNNLKEEL